jgi:peroxiredoxin
MRFFSCCLPALSLVFSGGVFAADAVPSAGPKPGTVKLDPQVQNILTAASQFYTARKSFEADLASTTHVEASTMKSEMTSSFHLAVQPPASFALVIKTGMPGGTLISDGKTWITFVQYLNKYTSNDAPASLSELLQPANLALVEGGTPLGFEALLGPDPVKALSTGLTSSADLGVEPIAGQSAHHLQIAAVPYITDIWIAAPQPLLLQSRVSIDMSAALKNLTAEQKQKMPAGLGLEQMKMSRDTTYSNWQIDQPIAATTFQFQPPPGAQLVDELVKLPPHPLVGKMAPDFQLNDLDGHPVSLASLRGKIVVLDFWATWCGPCVASLPLVSSVADSFKDQGVVFYAMNLKETAGQVRQFQAQKALAFPVLLDANGKVSDLYQAQAIPETVLIDPAGKIEAVHVGYDAGIKKKLTAQLTAMIAGKDIAAAPAPTGP